MMQENILIPYYVENLTMNIYKYYKILHKYMLSS
jgi:hypothetical protein